MRLRTTTPHTAGARPFECMACEPPTSAISRRFNTAAFCPDPQHPVQPRQLLLRGQALLNERVQEERSSAVWRAAGATTARAICKKCQDFAAPAPLPCLPCVWLWTTTALGWGRASASRTTGPFCGRPPGSGTAKDLRCRTRREPRPARAHAQYFVLIYIWTAGTSQAMGRRASERRGGRARGVVPHESRQRVVRVFPVPLGGHLHHHAAGWHLYLVLSGRPPLTSTGTPAPAGGEREPPCPARRGSTGTGSPVQPGRAKRRAAGSPHRPACTCAAAASPVARRQAQNRVRAQKMRVRGSG